MDEALALAADAVAVQLADYAEAGDNLPTEPVGTLVASIEAEVPRAILA